MKLLPTHVAHFNKECCQVISDAVGAKVFFTDGSSHSADVVIGCDGIKSVTRTAVVGRVVQPKFTRTIVFRGLIPIEAGVKAVGPSIRKRPHTYIGPHGV